MSPLTRVLPIVVFSVSLTVPLRSARGEELCTPEYQPPSQPYTEEVYRCLSTVIFAINRGESGNYQDLGDRLIRALLTNRETPEVYRTTIDPPWMQIAEVIAILDSQALVDLFVETIGAPHDGEETDQAYAQLYAWEAPKVLRSLSKYSDSDRAGRIDSLSWAIANFYWGHINLHNYKRVPIGPYWELLDHDNPLRPIAEEIEKSLVELGLPDK